MSLIQKVQESAAAMPMHFDFDLDINKVIDEFNQFWNPQPQVCGETETLSDDEFLLEYFKATYYAIVEGMYNKKKVHLGDQCFGPELLKTTKETVDLLNRLAEDPFEPKA